jgi:hypothetical protein
VSAARGANEEITAKHVLHPITGITPVKGHRFKDHNIGTSRVVNRGGPCSTAALPPSGALQGGQSFLGMLGQTGLDIKDKFNNLWLGDLSDKKLTNKNEKYSGLKIELKGRLRGAAKSKKLSNIKGSVKSQSIDYYIEYNKKEIYTK